MITHGVILPGSQVDEAKGLMVSLAERGVLGWQVYVVVKGEDVVTMVFDVPDTELGKLPSDEDGPYLGDEHSGHAFTAIEDEQVRGLASTGDSTYIIQGPQREAS